MSADSTLVLVDGDTLALAAPGPKEQHKLGALYETLLDALSTLGEVRVFVGRGNKKNLNTLRRAATEQNVKLVEVGGKRGSNIDLAIAVAGASEFHRLTKLVLVSGDADCETLLLAARERKVLTEVIWSPTALPVPLALAADGILDLATLHSVTPPLQRLRPAGKIEALTLVSRLISPGGGSDVLNAIAHLIGTAKHEVTIIDAYLGVQTTRLLTFARPHVHHVLISRAFKADVVEDVNALRAAGRMVALVLAEDMHDRWLRVDARWWHSGGSLKDLGRRYSRFAEITSSEEKQHCGQMEENLMKLSKSVSHA